MSKQTKVQNEEVISSQKQKVFDKSKTDKSNKKDLKELFEDFSMKETGILLLGIFIIFVAILFVPKWFNDLTTHPPKTLDELHADNYQNPETNTSFIYNGFSFVLLNDARTSVDFWYTQYERDGKLFNVPFRYSPRDVENISKISINKTQRRLYSKVYITVDPSEEPGSKQFTALAVSEFTGILAKVKNYPIFGACTRNETTACVDRPIITCNDRGDFLTFYFKEGEEPGILINDNCITISGTDKSLLKATDKTIYGFLGIMD